MIPSPRSGLLYHWDTLIGPGASRAEERLILGGAVGGTVLVLLHAWAQGIDWTPLQLLAAAALALDLFGGVIANATVAGRRWYHREGQGRRDHLVFVGVHAVQLLVTALVFPNAGLGYFAAAYAYLMTASAVILWTPAALQRPSAYLLLTGGLLLALYGVQSVAGMEWFLPVLYLKLLVSHLLSDG